MLDHCRRARRAWLRLAFIVLPGLAPVSFARAQQAGFAERMAPLSQVLADQAAADPIETRIQQAAACQVMSDAIELLMGVRYFRSQFQGDEQARREDFASCVGNRMGHGNEPSALKSRIVGMRRRSVQTQAGRHPALVKG